MTDRYANIRKALETGPTPGPWFVDGMEIVSALGSDSGDGCQACDVHRWTIAEISELEAAVEGLGLVQLSLGVKLANAALIAACDPDTIRALLEERDADLKRLAFLSKEPVVEGFVGITKDVYDYACDCAEEDGRDEPNDEDMLNGMRRLIDAAIAVANGDDND